MLKKRPEFFKLGETYIKFEYEFNEDNKNKIIKALRNELKTSFKENLKNRGEIRISIEFEKGSLKTKIIIWGTIIYLGIGNYGSFRGGVKEIINDARIFSEYVTNQLTDNSEISIDDIEKIERRGGIPGRIEKIYKNIELLEKNLPNLSPNKLQKEVSKIKQEVANIKYILSPNDEQAFIGDLSNIYSNDLPEPNEKQTNYIISRYGIKPTEETKYLE
jgi:hypothetical protein